MKADKMCSNCSGDDLAPETFASFDVSSPEHRHAFAGRSGRKRRRYGTSRKWNAIINTALILMFERMRRKASILKIIRNVDRGHFVNLNLSSSYDEERTKRGSDAGLEGLIEIRVSTNSIIEVYSDTRNARSSDNGNDFEEHKHTSPWEESYAERGELRRAMQRFRRGRRLKYFVAYGAFATVAALAVWCAIR
jgi:hypothetical protein